MDEIRTRDVTSSVHPVFLFLFPPPPPLLSLSLSLPLSVPSVPSAPSVRPLPFSAAVYVSYLPDVTCHRRFATAFGPACGGSWRFWITLFLLLLALHNTDPTPPPLLSSPLILRAKSLLHNTTLSPLLLLRNHGIHPLYTPACSPPAPAGPATNPDAPAVLSLPSQLLRAQSNTNLPPHRDRGDAEGVCGTLCPRGRAAQGQGDGRGREDGQGDRRAAV